MADFTEREVVVPTFYALPISVTPVITHLARATHRCCVFYPDKSTRSVHQSPIWINSGQTEWVVERTSQQWITITVIPQYYSSSGLPWTSTVRAVCFRLLLLCFHVHLISVYHQIPNGTTLMQKMMHRQRWPKLSSSSETEHPLNFSTLQNVVNLDTDLDDDGVAHQAPSPFRHAIVWTHPTTTPCSVYAQHGAS